MAQFGKIALEEHFLPEDFMDYWLPSVAGLPQGAIDRLRNALIDTGDARIEMMDRNGVDISVLSVAGPGAQCEQDTSVALRRARESNDLLAEKIARHPTRYRGFAHLCMQDPAEDAKELERCVKQLGFVGALINGQTRGRYLDEDYFAPLWEVSQALKAPLYLHPGDPEETYAALRGQLQLRRPAWEWTVETATHALRMVFNGTFERFPHARLILGHMGETIPYGLWRFDSRAAFNASPTARKHPPSYYIKRNLAVTISGVNSLEPLNCALGALGTDKVMFAADYPFEDTKDASEFIDNAAISDDLRRKVCSQNAAALLGIKV